MLPFVSFLSVERQVQPRFRSRFNKIESPFGIAAARSFIDETRDRA